MLFGLYVCYMLYMFTPLVLLIPDSASSWLCNLDTSIVYKPTNLSIFVHEIQTTFNISDERILGNKNTGKILEK